MVWGWLCFQVGTAAGGSLSSLYAFNAGRCFFELLFSYYLDVMATITVVMKVEHAVCLGETYNISEEITFLLGDALECENFASGVAQADDSFGDSYINYEHMWFIIAWLFIVTFQSVSEDFSLYKSVFAYCSLLRQCCTHFGISPDCLQAASYESILFEYFLDN